MSMNTPLRLLIVEDSKDDTELILHVLKSAGYEVTAERVDDKESMRRAMDCQKWDVITSDHAMPNFNAPAALAMAKEICPELPFIIVSGEMDINLVVTLMKSGAQDYIQKRELVRLPQAIARVLREVVMHRQHQQAEEARQESERRYQQVFDAIPDALFVLDRETGAILDVNTAACQLYGYSREEMLGLKNTDVSAEPEETGQALKTGVERVILRYHRKKDGNRFPVELTATYGYQDDRPISVVASRDVTERQRIEESFRQSETDFRTLIECAPIAIVMMRGDSRVYANPAYVRLFGYTTIDELLERPSYELIAPQCRQAAKDLNRRRNRGDTAPLEYETVGLRKDGTQFPFHASAAEVERVDGPTMIVFIDDITERKRVTATLERRATQLALLNNVSQQITAVLEVQGVLDRATRLVQESFRYHHVALFLLDQERNVLVMKARAGLFVDLFPADHHLPLGKGMVGWVGQNGQSLLANDVAGEPRYVNFYPGTVPTGAELSVPIQVGQKVVGVLDVQSPERDAFDEEDVRVLETLADEIAAAIDNARLYESIQQELADRQHAEEALREREAKLDSIFRAAPVGIGVVVNRVLTEVNDRMCEMTGYSKDELLGQSSRIVYPTLEDYEFVGREKYRQINERGTGAVETRWQRKDGAILDIWLSSTPIDPADLSLGVTFTAVDFTERKRAEEALRESEERYRALVENSTMGVGISQRNRVVFANPALLQIFGYDDLDEFVKIPLIQHVAPSSKEMILRMGKNDPEESIPAEFEYDIQRKDGQIRTLYASTALISLGGEYYRQTTFQDITERKQVEANLRESEQMLRLILNTIPVRVFWKDLNLIYLGCNRTFAEDSGFSSPDDLIGKDDYVMGWANEAELYRADDRRVIETGQPKLAYEEPETTPDGKKIWLRTSKVPLRDARGEIRGVLGTYEDITTRRQAEEEIRTLNAELERRVAERTAQLEATNKELESFSYSVSHDLRAPLRSLDGFSQALLEDYADKLDEQGHHYLNSISNSARRMNHLIEDLLKLSRLIQGELHRVPVDLSSMAHDLAREMQQLEPDRVVEFVIADRLTAYADERLIGIVMENLLNNAWKFTSKLPEAHIEFGSYVTPEKEMVFFVSDNGAGFDMAYADRLFGAFQRLHTDKDFPGTGVGLATVKRIVHRHGGRVWVESEPDHGATFYFTIG